MSKEDNNLFIIFDYVTPKHFTKEECIKNNITFLDLIKINISWIEFAEITMDELISRITIARLHDNDEEVKMYEE
ncbi:MAG: hypothetical protein ACOCP8_00895 [archaeon]